MKLRNAVVFLSVFIFLMGLLPLSVYAENFVEQSSTLPDDTKYLSSSEEVVQTIRNCLVNRQETITVGFAADTYDESCGATFWDAALSHTGVPTEGDYLQWNLAECEIEVITYASDDTYYMDITYKVSYYTNAEQEAAVSEQVVALLNELNPSGSDYAKIKTVYDWICSNINYDYANLNDESHSLKYTAYAALIDKTAVCQGYALLLYRLALEMGIDCRIITGTSHDQSHAWNIICIDGQYYNLDSTWDAELEEYQYFLKCDANFEDHIRNDPYISEEFAANYPMSDTDYVVEYEIYQEGDFEYYLFENAATLVKYHGTDADVTIPGTVKNLPVTVIGNEAFYDNDTLKKVTIPTTVQSIADGELLFDFEHGYHGVGAFRECGLLTEVLIPADSQLSYIGEFAFNNSALSSITLPSSIRELALSCFEGTQLTELALPEGLESFGQNVVGGTKITELHLPSTCTWFHCFNNLDSLEYISVAEGNPNYRSHEGVLYAYDTPYFSGGWGLWIYPKCKPDTTYTVTDYCEYIFGDSVAGEGGTPSYLRQFYIGNSKSVGGDFSEETISRFRCEIIADESNPYYTSQDGMLFTKDMKTLLQVSSYLTGTVTIPEGVEEIAEYAAEWGNYTNIVIPDTVTSIGDAAFWYTYTLEEIYIPDSVTYLGGSAFQTCTNLETCRLSANIIVLNYSTFLDCAALQYLVLPEGLENIDWQALAVCSSLKYVYIPSSVTSINWSAFFTEYTHSHIFYGGTEEEWKQIEIIGDQTLLDTAVYHYETVIGIDDASLSIEKPDHTYVPVGEIIEPTCTEGGYDLHICACGSRSGGELGPLGHAPGETQIENLVPATCSSKGSYDYVTYCIVCEEELSRESFILDTAIHNYDAVVTDPTCTEQGYTTHTCTECGDSYADTYVDSLGHNFGDSPVTTEPTCTQEGYTFYICEVCGDKSFVTSTASLGHDYSYEMTTAPTADEPGTLTGTCSRCADTVTVVLPALNTADYTYTVLSEPTESKDGTAEYTWNVTDYGTITIEVTLPALTPDFLLGDVNNDGNVNTVDAMLVLQYAVGMLTADELTMAASDVNQDGTTNTIDAMLILQYAVGLVTSLPVN